ncbi:hypothetical protein [Kibdelosporangium phytohabitans]|uniref:hypothetical protein n=1 Tax=Kibdelosporangium phytohabitans TaxID=860235 RepID=UPI0012FBD8E1|nr:hypothetical protein [Kibdelosporangium phytohabitans]MBE1461040.1 hypothetical protein [Kibdelosporangium phytohabitans]
MNSIAWNRCETRSPPTSPDLGERRAAGAHSSWSAPDPAWGTTGPRHIGHKGPRSDCASTPPQPNRGRYRRESTHAVLGALRERPGLIDVVLFTTGGAADGVQAAQVLHTTRDQPLLVLR